MQNPPRSPPPGSKGGNLSGGSWQSPDSTRVEKIALDGVSGSPLASRDRNAQTPSDAAASGAQMAHYNVHGGYGSPQQGWNNQAYNSSWPQQQALSPQQQQQQQHHHQQQQQHGWQQGSPQQPQHAQPHAASSNQFNEYYSTSSVGVVSQNNGGGGGINSGSSVNATGGSIANSWLQSGGGGGAGAGGGGGVVAQDSSTSGGVAQSWVNSQVSNQWQAASSPQSNRNVNGGAMTSPSSMIGGVGAGQLSVGSSITGAAGAVSPSAS